MWPGLGTTLLSVSLLLGGHPPTLSTTSQEGIVGTSPTAQGFLVSGKDEGGMEQGSLMVWVALGYVGDSAPRGPGQPLVVSGGSCTLVAMTTPPWERREARPTSLFELGGAEGASPGPRGGQGLGREQTRETRGGRRAPASGNR